MNRAPSSQSNNGEDLTNRQRFNSAGESEDEDQPVSELMTKLKSALPSRKKRVRPSSDDESGSEEDDPNDDDWNGEGEGEEDEEEAAGEYVDSGDESARKRAAAPAAKRTKAIDGKAKAAPKKPAPEEKAKQNLQALLKAVTITTKKVSTRLVKNKDGDEEEKELCYPEWIDLNAVPGPTLQNEAKKRGWGRVGGNPNGDLLPTFLRYPLTAPLARQWLREYCHKNKDFSAADPPSQEDIDKAKQRRENSANNRAREKVARGQAAKSATPSTALVVVAEDSDEDIVMPRRGRGRPPTNATQLNNALRDNMKLTQELSAATAALATSNKLLKDKQDILSKHDAELEVFRKENAHYKLELKSKGDQAYDNKFKQEKQQQEWKAEKSELEAAILEVSGSEALKQIQGHVDAATAQRKGVANAPWARAEMQANAATSATEVAIDAGEAVLRSLSEAASAYGDVVDPEALQEIRQAIRQRQQSLKLTVETAEAIATKVGKLKGAINDAINGAINKKARKAERAEKKAKRAEKKKAKAGANPDPLDEQFTMENEGFEAQAKADAENAAASHVA
jgi:hypothetical protein